MSPGPAQGDRARIATKRPTDATIDAISSGNRHHGMRFARNVETGTEAATTESTRTRESTVTRVRSEPMRPFHTSRTTR